MSAVKRGKFYWADFYFRGKRHQFSTKQTNKQAAQDVETAAKGRLLKGEMGIRERKPAPLLKDFIKGEFLPWVESTFAEKRNTRVWYRGGCARLREFAPLADSPLDEIEGAKIGGYVAKRQADKLNVTSINRELQILRRILHVAFEWGRVERIAKVKMLPGEPRRERVLSREEEVKYLGACASLLFDVAVVLIDSALRPEELNRLEWENVSFINGKNGCIRVLRGKTHSAARIVPLTARVREVLERRCDAAGNPQTGYVFSASTASGHVEPSTLRGLHKLALTASKVRAFPLYTFRHSALTRWAEAGMSPFLLAQLAGHSSVKISQRYIHLTDDSLAFAAMERAGALPATHQQPLALLSANTTQG